MSSCEITCPYCQLTFTEDDVSGYDIDNTGETDCPYCNQPLQVAFKAVLTSEVYIDEENFEKMKKIGQKKKNNLFVISLCTKRFSWDTFLTVNGTESGNMINANIFVEKDDALAEIKRSCKKYPNAKVIKYGEANK